MLKKFTVVVLSLCMALGMVACGKKEEEKGISLTDKYTETMLITPESVKLEKGFLDEYPNVNNIVLPKDYDKNLEEITDEIASFAQNKKVKCIIVCSDKEGLLPVFEKIREKNDSLITVAAGIEEMQIKEKQNDVETNSYISMGFNPTDTDNNVNAVKMAKAMGTKVFVNYVDSFAKNDIASRKIIKEIHGECNRNRLKYVEVEVPNMKDENDSKTTQEFIMKDATNKKKAYGEDVSLYGCRESMDKAVIEAAIKNKLMVPTLHSLNSAELYCDILGIKVAEDDIADYKKINSIISKKLKTLGMDGRLAGTEIPEKAFCVEAAIETTNKIFTKKGDEFNVFKEMPENIKEKTGILAEYTKVRYDSNFFRVVEMYPTLY